MKIISPFIILLVLLSQFTFAQVQTDLDRFNIERVKINKDGMAVLTAWSLANIAAGGIGFGLASEGEARYFHQMNGLWGIINGALGGFGLLQAMKDHKTSDFEKTLKQQNGHEKIFLLNAGLDCAYMATGIALLENARVDAKRSERYRGWGHSIIIQGGALLVFDAIMFMAHNRHGKKKLTPIIKRATFSMNENGVGLLYRF